MVEPAGAPRRGGRVLWTVAAGLCLVAGPSWALHRETPPSVRVTSGGDHYLSSGRSWGNFLAFSSDIDLLQSGSTGRQIFLFNMAYFDCLRGTTRERTPCPKPPLPSLAQITDRPGGADNPTVDPKGLYIAYEADGVHGGGGGPQASRRQIFFLDRKKGELQQLTYSPAGDSTRPSMDRLAKVLVFESTAPLGTLGGPPGVSQVYAYFRLARRLVQLTNGRAHSHSSIMNSRGTQVAFESASALLGDGHDTGISQIFVVDLEPDGIGFRLKQLTNGNAPSRHPFIADRSGDAVVVFDSTATNLFGTTGGGGSQVYIAPSDLEGNLPRIERVTNQAEFGDCTYPVLSPSAEHLTFLCTGDPKQNGTVGNRIFVQNRSKEAATDPAVKRIWQITGRGDVQGPIGQSLGEWFIHFVSPVDTSGTESCGRQLQVIDYYGGHWTIADDLGEVTPDLLDPDPYQGPRSNLIGTRVVDFLEAGQANGSRVQVTSRDGPTVSAVVERGSLWLDIQPTQITGEAAIAIPMSNVALPPLPSGNGTYCLKMRADGEGIIDCNGGFFGGDVDVTQDHDISDVDLACRTGCLEDDPNCMPFGRLGPHVGVCNGKAQRVRSGLFASGGAVVRLPVTVSLSLNPGLLGWCTPTDDYAPVKINTDLFLTTGTARALITETDATVGAAITDFATGAPFDCEKLQKGDVNSGRLVGVLPLLDYPSPPTFKDTILNVTFETRARPRAPRSENQLGGHCSDAPCALDIDCDDQEPCNGIETCVNQTCLPGTPPCDDGDACNGIETCVKQDAVTAICGAGTPPVCDDSNLCTFDTCLPADGCLFVSTCDDGDACNGAEACDPITGGCGPSPGPLDCNDSNPCTTDSCDPMVGCTYGFSNSLCSDGNPCTTGDICAAGVCNGTPMLCSDSDVCNGLESCQAGACIGGTPLDCDDANLCTNDSCDPLGGCAHTDNSDPCDDGNLCTFADVCQSGACSGLAVLCDDGDACNGVETCDAGTGGCLLGSPPNCDDGNPCTIDTCDPGPGCVHTPIGPSCLVIELHRKVEDTAAARLGGEKQKRRLMRLLARAERQAQRAERKRGAPKRKSLLAAKQSLKQFTTLIDTGTAKGTIDVRAGRQLIDQGNIVANEIDKG